ncbi:MAG: MFS transporter [Clostridia bacterium]
MSIKEFLNYSLYVLGNGAIGGSLIFVATVALLPYFYRIDTIHAYIIVASGSLLNMIVQPFLGNLMERTNTKFGKYKPYILCMMPLYVILVILVLWVPQFESENSRIIYAYCTCIPALLCYVFANNMALTMPTIITPNQQERADVMTPVSLIGGLIPSLIALIAGPLRSHFGLLGKEFVAIRIIGIGSVSIGILLVFFLLRVKERVHQTIDANTQKVNKVSVIEALKMLSKNKPLKILCFALILGSLREFSALFRWLIIQFRFAENVNDAIKISGIPMSIMSLGFTVSAFLMPVLTRKFSKKVVLIIYTSCALIGNSVLAIIGYENIPIGMTSLIVVTIFHFISAMAIASVIVPIMLGDIADYQQFISGKRLEGHLQNLLITVPLLCSQIFMMGSWFWQRKIGFEPKDFANSAVLTLHQRAITCQWFDVVSIISAVSALLMIIVLLFYPLSKKKTIEVSNYLENHSVYRIDSETEVEKFVESIITDNTNNLREVIKNLDDDIDNIEN